MILFITEHVLFIRSYIIEHLYIYIKGTVGAIKNIQAPASITVLIIPITQIAVSIQTHMYSFYFVYIMCVT